ATAVRHRADGLEQEQAFVGRGGEQPSAAPFLDQMLIIFGRLESEQRQLKPVLTAGFSVAATAVAGQLGENGNNLVGEIDRSLAAEVVHGSLQVADNALRRLGNDGSCSIGAGNDEAGLVDLDHSRGSDLELHL